MQWKPKQEMAHQPRHCQDHSVSIPPRLNRSPLPSFRHTDALTTLYPFKFASLCNRWCVLPKVMQGQQQVMAQVSIGSKQPKNDDDHSPWPCGAVMPAGFLAVAEARVTQPSMSCCISDLGAAAIAAVLVLVREGGK